MLQSGESGVCREEVIQNFFLERNLSKILATTSTGNKNVCVKQLLTLFTHCSKSERVPAI